MADAKEETNARASWEDFQQALVTAASLVATGALHWRISGNLFITSRLDEGAIAEKFGAADAPERKQFERILSREIISSMLRVVKSPGASLYELPPERSEEEKQDQQRRDEAVAKALVTEQLKHRLLVRQTSKGPVIDQLRWDISIKKHDLGTGTVPSIPYATIELKFGQSSSPVSGPFNFLEVLGATRQTVAFDVHLDDLEAILRDLTDLKNSLQELTTSERGT